MVNRSTLAFMFLACLLGAGSTAADVDGEWAQCPSVGVPTRVDPVLKQGKLLCTYFHASRQEVLQSSWVSSKSGQPFKSCLRDNSRYGEKNGTYATRAYCSTTLSQDALNKTAYKWGRYTGDNKKLKRVKLAQTNKSGGEYLLCRVKKSGYRLGHVSGGKCSYWDGKSTRTTTVFDSLLLTRGYGVPVKYPRNGQSTIWLAPDSKLPPGMSPDMTPRLCTTAIAPSAFDFNGIIGELPGIRLGPSCVSYVLGKSFVDKSKLAGRLAGLE